VRTPLERKKTCRHGCKPIFMFGKVLLVNHDLDVVKNIKIKKKKMVL
jgi:hypothetical protein